MSRPLRLHHAGPGRSFVVDAETVYADLDGDGRIARRDRYDGEAAADLIAAARYFADVFEVPFAGAPSRHPLITSGGRLNDRERAAFDADGVLAKRPDLWGHLDFFDRRSGDGVITVGENYRAWRDLGFAPIKSLVLTLGSAVVFGRAAEGFSIDIERIAGKRPAGSTGIYGRDGNVDPARLAEVMTVFASSPVLTHDQLRAALAAREPLGRIPARQFESLLALTGRQNGGATVTAAQFRALFDNSLFWAVASMPRGGDGRRL